MCNIFSSRRLPEGGRTLVPRASEGSTTRDLCDMESKIWKAILAEENFRMHWYRMKVSIIVIGAKLEEVYVKASYREEGKAVVSGKKMEGSIALKKC